jgi:ribosomal protein S6
MDIGPTQLPSFEKELKLDTDLIRPRLVKEKPKKEVDEVLHCWTSYEKDNS